MRRLIAGLAVVGALVAPAAAEAGVASSQDVRDAKKFARWYWQDNRGLELPCYAVGIRWEWMPFGDYGYVTVRGGSLCIVHLSSRVHWGWWKLCATVIHEYGHIVGYGHTRKPGSIMYAGWPNPVWGRRFWACEYS